MSSQNLFLSNPMTLSDIENVYKNVILKQEFYNTDYAVLWLNNRTPSAAMASYIKNVIGSRKVLDVGCGMGQLVHELRELGVEAYGIEYSKSFIEMSPIKQYIFQGDIQHLEQFEDGSFDLVVCMEVLEHLPPTYLNAVISELKRIAGECLLVTIPSFGPNEYGYSGLPLNEDPWIRDALENTPFRNIVVDSDNKPDCGHITLATYRWWTGKFLLNGLIRDPVLENRGYTEYEFHRHNWNVYVLKKMAVDDVDVRKDNFFIGDVYGLEDWGNERLIRWTGKRFSFFICHMSASEEPCICLYCGPRELAYNRTLRITTYALKEDRDLKISYVKSGVREETLSVDQWFMLSMLTDCKDTGIYKIEFEVEQDFIPEYLIRNRDVRSLGIAFYGVDR